MPPSVSAMPSHAIGPSRSPSSDQPMTAVMSGASAAHRAARPAPRTTSDRKYHVSPNANPMRPLSANNPSWSRLAHHGQGEPRATHNVVVSSKAAVRMRSRLRTSGPIRLPAPAKRLEPIAQQDAVPSAASSPPNLTAGSLARMESGRASGLDRLRHRRADRHGLALGRGRHEREEREAHQPEDAIHQERARISPTHHQPALPVGGVSDREILERHG